MVRLYSITANSTMWTDTRQCPFLTYSGPCHRHFSMIRQAGFPVFTVINSLSLEVQWLFLQCLKRCPSGSYGSYPVSQCEHVSFDFGYKSGVIGHIEHIWEHQPWFYHLLIWIRLESGSLPCLNPENRHNYLRHPVPRTASTSHLDANKLRLPFLHNFAMYCRPGWQAVATQPLQLMSFVLPRKSASAVTDI